MNISLVYAAIEININTNKRIGYNKGTVLEMCNNRENCAI